MRHHSSIGEHQQGFSLLQLLIAIVVVAVLLGLLIPVIQGVRQRAAGPTCLNGMRQMYVALFAYKADCGYLPPGHLNEPGDPLGLKMADHLVPRYLARMPYCPLIRLTPAGAREFSPKTERQHFEETGTYSLNAFLTYSRLEALPGPYYGGFPYPGDSRMLFLAEVYYSGLTWAADQLRFTLDGADWPTVRVAPRHHGNLRLNFMFLDGHAELIAPKVLANGSYDWSQNFDSWGRNGTYINARSIAAPPENKSH